MDSQILIAVARLEERLTNLQRTVDDLKSQSVKNSEEMRESFRNQEAELNAQLNDIRQKYTLLSRFTLVERIVFGTVAVVLATVLGAVLAGAIPGGS